MIKKPIFFERNRVGRVYTGGLLFSNFFGDEPVDGFEPEEWIASGVKAINKIQKSQKEGISKIRGQDQYFDELLTRYPQELLGENGVLRILVKALDSAIRLPAQAHPDKAFSRKYFNSDYGKTECWIILDTRPDAKLFFGFKDGVSEEEFRKAIRKSETDPNAMEALMEVIHPKKGEVYLVPARTVHAIGKGCLILEIQEPTDFTIQPEHYCGTYKLNEREMYMGLSLDEAVSCFDFTATPKALIEPTVLKEKTGFLKESLIDNKHTDCFIINRIKLSGGEYKPDIEDRYGIYIVTDGNGRINGKDYDKSISKGDYFFMPASLMGQFTLSGEMEIIECY